ncbi:MAG: hypothetical protein QXE63_00975 [Zestosphaera sp.]
MSLALCGVGITRLRCSTGLNPAEAGNVALNLPETLTLQDRKEIRSSLKVYAVGLSRFRAIKRIIKLCKDLLRKELRKTKTSAIASTNYG